MNNYHLLVFILFIYSVNGEYKMIGTGKGVLSAHQTGSSSFVVKEIPFSYSDANIWWNLERDANYVNGVFIHPKNHPDLVWDSKGTTLKIYFIHLINLIQGIKSIQEHQLSCIQRRRRWAIQGIKDLIELRLANMP